MSPILRVMHTSIYLGDDGQTAVVASDYPVGFHLDEGDREYWSGAPSHYVLCAHSVGEFAWRWRMNNEIFYRCASKSVPHPDEAELPRRIWRTELA